MVASAVFIGAALGLFYFGFFNQDPKVPGFYTPKKVVPAAAESDEGEEEEEESDE